MVSFYDQLFDNVPERQKIIDVLQILQSYGARPYVVGGAVRDILAGHTMYDLDIEVHAISLEVLQEVLEKFGHVNLVGKSFGVLRWEHSAIEWTVPRYDLSGRKPVVVLDPMMGIVEALRRRDLTINAMAFDLVTRTVIDPFGGQNDLKNNSARSPDVRFFSEDPLRFFRIMHFIGRFELIPDEQLNKVCATMDLRDVAQERIFSEFDKLFLRSRVPSRGIRWMHMIKRLPEVLPELAATCDVEQSPQWHPEGDVFEHLMQALDAAAQSEYTDTEERLLILPAALCHDLGKAIATKRVGEKIRSIGHEIVGVPLARALMNRITGHKKRKKRVEVLVRYHMSPLQFYHNKAGDAAYKKLAVKVSPDVTLRQLIYLASADLRGRNGKAHVPLETYAPLLDGFIDRVKTLGLLDGPEKPILSGADFLDVLEPGVLIGKAVDRAYEIQLYENIRDKTRLKKRVVHELRQKA